MGRVYDPRSRNLGQKYHGTGAIPIGPQVRIPKPAISTALAVSPSISIAPDMLVAMNHFEPPYLVAHVNGFKLLRQIGAKGVRFGITWSNMQPTALSPVDYSEYDSIVANAGPDMELFVVISTTGPTWANGGFPANAFPTYGTPAYYNWVSNYATFVAGLVNRYKGVIKNWQILNEVGTPASGFWKENNSNNAPNIDAYVYIYNVLYDVIKGIDPTLNVWLAGLTHLNHWFGTNAIVGLEYLKILFRDYAIRCDGVALHPYTNDSPGEDPNEDYGDKNSFRKDIMTAQALMRTYGYQGKQLVIDEWGQYTGPDAQNAAYLYSSLSILENELSVKALGPNNAGVTKAFFYHLMNDRNPTTGLDINRTGLFQYDPPQGPSIIQPMGQAYQDWINNVRNRAGVGKTVTLSPAVSYAIARNVIGTTLIISNGNFTLINGGAAQLVVIDNFGNSVTPTAVVSSDTAKVTATTAGLLNGVAESGSVTITVSAAGYPDAVITVTNSGGYVSFDPDTIVGNDGDAIGSVTDSAGNVWTEATAKPKLRKANNGLNGHNALEYIRASSHKLTAPSSLAQFNQTEVSLFTFIKPYSDVDTGNRALFISATATQGFNLSMTAVNRLVLNSYDSGAVNRTNTNTTNITVNGGWKQVGFRLKSGTQTVYHNFNLETSGTQTYQPQVTSPVTQKRGTVGSGNYWNGMIAREWAYNRYITDAEVQQVFLAMQKYAIATSGNITVVPPPATSSSVAKDVKANRIVTPAAAVSTSVAVTPTTA